jgi:shikimate dehydrogenase
MIQLGLIGYPLSHSLSPKLHETALAAVSLQGEYRLYPVEPGDIGGLAVLTTRMRVGEIQGLNVTIPHKQAIMSLMDELTASSQAIGAVNTVSWQDGKLIGDNTDAPGFRSDLTKFLPNTAAKKKALVLGAGGAARAVVYALLKDGWQVALAVRKADLGQADALIKSFAAQAGAESMDLLLLESKDMGRLESGIQLIVNATPIGMFPDSDHSAWPEGLPFPKGAAVYDLVYNPRQTRLVREAQAASLRATTGLGMLVEQAALSFAGWTGRDVAREILFGAVEA